MMAKYIEVLFYLVSCLTVNIFADNSGVLVKRYSPTTTPPEPPAYTVIFDLSTYDKNSPRTHVLKKYEILSGTSVIRVVNVPSTVGFFIIQAHSFFSPLALSNVSYPEEHYYAKGTSVGLVQHQSWMSSEFTYYVWTFGEDSSTEILLVITIYGEDDPIPGGCNLTFDVEEAPYQEVNFTDSLVHVDVQAASVEGRTCEDNAVTLEFYHMFLVERDLNKDNYFDGIEKMLTVDGIRENGWKFVNKHNGYFRLRTYYSAYPGTGTVYAVVAVFKNRSSAYVPIVSYSCDVSRWFEDCVKPVETYWKVFCAVVFFWGLFICFYGHRFFKLFMFTSGYIFGGFATYICIVFSDPAAERTSENFVLTNALATVYGVIWVLIWWKYGKPVLSVFLPLFLNGILLASLLFYVLLGDMYIFQNDINFWTVFMFIVFCYVVLLLGITLYASFLTSSILGSFATIMSIDHYVGSNLRYILINTIRRITVYNFDLAIIHPPIQAKDIVLYCFWGFLIVSGTFYQWYQHRGKPPFPPPTFFNRRRDLSTVSQTERTPLISSSAVSYTEPDI